MRVFVTGWHLLSLCRRVRGFCCSSLWNNVLTTLGNWGQCPKSGREARPLNEEWKKFVCTQLRWNRPMDTAWLLVRFLPRCSLLLQLCSSNPALPPPPTSLLLNGSTHKGAAVNNVVTWPLGGASVISPSGPCSNEGTPSLVYKYCHHPSILSCPSPLLSPFSVPLTACAFVCADLP